MGRAAKGGVTGPRPVPAGLGNWRVAQRNRLRALAPAAGHEANRQPELLSVSAVCSSGNG